MYFCKIPHSLKMHEDKRECTLKIFLLFAVINLLSLKTRTDLLLADQHIRQVNGLKCYQCVQGVNYFCDENDMSPISCTNDTGKCAVSKFLCLNFFSKREYV